jgi:cobyrinic acid a,c-diamide synthase
MRRGAPSCRGGGLILAAPASGSGKTLLTLGLLRLLRDRGVRIAAAKAGPDYIDPTFHRAASRGAASGGICLNLDAWAMRKSTLAALVDTVEHRADFVLCEGVMGLFDGTGHDGEAGSTAALAWLTGWPVVLVVDAHRQGASAAALVAGFARHDPATPLAGVIFNRVAGPRHLALLEDALARHLPALPRLGAVMQDPALGLPERHLGLVPAGERQSGTEAAIARAADAVAAGLDVERLMSLDRPTAAGKPQAADPPLPPLGRHIAVARDDAFVFAYPSVLSGWRAAGAELSFFAPLADQAPDPDADAVYLPGGYPELHAGRLAACERFLGGLRRMAGERKAIYGECGGYMALGERLTASDGGVHRMAGLLPLATSFAERRLHLGYREATLLAAGPLGKAGTRFRGHEFHYATTVSEGEAAALFATADACNTDLGPAGLRRGSVSGSFIHLIDRAED